MLSAGANPDLQLEVTLNGSVGAVPPTRVQGQSLCTKSTSEADIFLFERLISLEQAGGHCMLAGESWLTSNTIIWFLQNTKLAF